jgi:hypothetical protein
MLYLPKIPILEGLAMEIVGFLWPFCLVYVRPNGTFYGYLLHFVVICYIFARFGMF